MGYIQPVQTVAKLRLSCGHRTKKRRDIRASFFKFRNLVQAALRDLRRATMLRPPRPKASRGNAAGSGTADGAAAREMEYVSPLKIWFPLSSTDQVIGAPLAVSVRSAAPGVVEDVKSLQHSPVTPLI